jgi:hypothetical protein
VPILTPLLKNSKVSGIGLTPPTRHPVCNVGLDSCESSRPLHLQTSQAP